MEVSYVNRKFVYQKYMWPPSIELAELHSRCSEPGPQNPLAIQCPCCHQKLKYQIKSWLFRNIYKDFKKYGGAIPAYFSLLLYYLIFIFIILLLNGIYPLYWSYIICQQFTDKCIKLYSVIPFIAYQQLNSLLLQKGYYYPAKYIEYIHLTIFVVLQIANLLILVYLHWIQSYCQKQIKLVKNFALLIKNVYGFNQQQIRNLIKQNIGNVPIVEIVIFKSMATTTQLFQQRVRSYFQIKGFYTQALSIKQFIKKQQRLITLNQQFHQAKNKITSSRAIIVFQNNQDLERLHKILSMNQISKIYTHFKIFAGGTGRIFTDKAAQPRQIIWQNIGQDSTFKTFVRIKTTIISILFLVICYGVMYAGLAFQFNNYNLPMQKQTLYLILLISLILFAMVVSYRLYMVKLSKQRKPTTYLSQSFFIIATTVMFHLIFYLIIPTLFYVLSNGFNKTVKFYFVDSQARVFVIIQFILTVVDIFHCLWKGKKERLYVDSRLTGKYCQQGLHGQVQYPQFPIQFKLIILFKMWSFILFYGFISPIVTLMLLLILIVFYFNDKKYLYMHYTVRKIKGIQLQMRFVQVYIYFFCVYHLLTYLAISNYQWEQWVAVAFTISSILLQFITNFFYKMKKQNLRKQTLEGQSFYTVVKELQQSLLGQQPVQIRTQYNSYKGCYYKFVKQSIDWQMSKQIDEYVNEIMNIKQQRTYYQKNEKGISVALSNVN